MPIDATSVRRCFAALDPGSGDGWVHADGPAGSLMPDSVVAAIAGSMRAPLGNSGGTFPASARSDALRLGARAAVADLVGGSPDAVILGPSMTALTYTVARAMAATWRVGDEIVLSRLDHDANVRPWVQAAAAAGATVRWAEIDPDTCELPTAQYDTLLGERTRLVALTAASNAVGTRPDIAAVAARAHAVGALLYVDAVHAAPHVPLDLDALGADLLATSAYKWCGPHVAAVVGRPAVLERLHPDKLEPAPDGVPGRFEHGTPPFELHAGVSAAVDHIAGLTPATGPRRRRVLAAMAEVEAYETALFATLETGLREMAHVTLLGAPALRTPTLSFTVAGRTPRQVTEHLAVHRIAAWDGDYYARELMRALGVGAAVRLGLAHYSSSDEVGQILAAVGQLG